MYLNIKICAVVAEKVFCSYDWNGNSWSWSQMGVKTECLRLGPWHTESFQRQQILVCEQR